MLKTFSFNVLQVLNCSYNLNKNLKVGTSLEIVVLEYEKNIEKKKD